MSITLNFGSGVPQATKDAANPIVSAINSSGAIQDSKTITISKFSPDQLQNTRDQIGNTSTGNSKIHINQNFDYQGFNQASQAQWLR